MDFILLEPEDTDNLKNLLTGFKDLGIWAEENGQPVLALTVKRFSDFAHRHFSLQETGRDVFLSITEELLSDLQIHARNEYDFSKLNIIEKIDLLQSIPSDALEHETIEPDRTWLGRNVTVPNLRHPATLPSHLDMELFKNFLELQSSALDQMEECLLAIEKSFDIEHIQNLKRLIHTQKGEAGFLNLRAIEALFHGMEDFLDNDSICDQTDLFFSAIDWVRKTNTWYRGNSDEEPKTPQSLSQAFENLTYKSSTLPGDLNATSMDNFSTKVPIPHENRSRQTIRVDTERLDRLIDMIGELVVAKSMVVQSKEIQAIQSQELLKNIGQLNTITRALHEACLMLRMIPLKDTFQKMERLVRDTAIKSGKSVLCHTQGEDTKLDKILVDQIGEPLLHIIRNAVDHGIEASQAERVARGKPANGSIYIRAFQKNGYVFIEIEDDGRGIDASSIVQKARETGRIGPEHLLTEQGIFNLIFEPGFSTANQVTDLSGRGQGMSVVKRVVDSLQGHISFRSERGQGTAFTMKIPLTLAMIDGMVVKVGQERFIVPTLSIVTTCQLDENLTTTLISGEKTILVQGRIVPLVNLNLRFNAVKDVAQTCGPGLMVIVESSSHRIALVVDEIIGKQQVVIKNLGAGLIQSPGISGAAIMHDGTVGLVLDIDRLAQQD